MAPPPPLPTMHQLWFWDLWNCSGGRPLGKNSSHCPLTYPSLLYPSSNSTNSELFPHLVGRSAFQRQTKCNPPKRYLLLTCVQTQCFNKPRRVDVTPSTVLQQSKQVLEVFTNGLRLIVYQKAKGFLNWQVYCDTHSSLTIQQSSWIGAVLLPHTFNNHKFMDL